FLIPGEKIDDNTEYIQGYGTFIDKNTLYSSVLGKPSIINRLYTVDAYKTTRYFAEVGDVIIGRISSVKYKKWEVEINSRQKCTLALTAINLPGLVHRRKGEFDELNMSVYFDVPDLL
ncbi:Exosome complex component N-terminal domain, partial [Trinorchestia longiramus]